MCEELPNSYNDVDLGFKLKRLGKKLIYVPSIQFVHFESISRDPMVGEEETYACFFLSTAVIATTVLPPLWGTNSCPWYEVGCRCRRFRWQCGASACMSNRCCCGYGRLS
jgi:hypothetical protein